MSSFESLPEFDRELARLSKKYRSLTDDIEMLKKVLVQYPVGMGTNFVTIHHAPTVRIVKARLACKSLRDRSMRIIYAYHGASVTFVWLELYFKGVKENEDRARIREYLRSLGT